MQNRGCSAKGTKFCSRSICTYDFSAALWAGKYSDFIIHVFQLLLIFVFKGVWIFLCMAIFTGELLGRNVKLEIAAATWT
jgi:hypothetical protein